VEKGLEGAVDSGAQPLRAAVTLPIRGPKFGPESPPSALRAHLRPRGPTLGPTGGLLGPPGSLMLPEAGDDLAVEEHAPLGEGQARARA
jgi:hypothetical protein